MCLMPYVARIVQDQPAHPDSLSRVRFNESDHGRVTMVVPANNRRATITGFNRERRSSFERMLFDILSSDRSPPLTPRLLVARRFVCTQNPCKMHADKCEIHHGGLHATCSTNAKTFSKTASF
ncbi:hypothetical protein DPMN_113062 [Dreissena polymorpha]|uniref:Uncharacterized protein n=1 Tax=Dreissena polymorpha TaxID=45954 RepID=A0A9D4KGT5_DREPO|nr:hypothetical protein DPMN_113062 [Dreissena polymorpha]